MPAPTSLQLAQHRQFLQREKVYEKRYAKQFYKWIQDSDRTAATAYANGEDWQLAIQDITPFPIYERLYMQATINEAKLEYRMLVPESDIKQKDLIDDLVGILSSGERGNLITLWRGLLGDFLNIRLANRITQVTNTTRDRIASLIEQSLNEGLGAEETAKRIRNDQQYSRNRSLAIARTESITAMNQGKYLAAFSSPYESEKKWLPTIDDRTRASHADMYDRPWIDLVAPFWLANSDGVLEQGQYPGDGTFTASNVVNCRCAIQIRSKRGQDGRLIRKQ